MDIHQLCNKLKLNQSKISKLAYCTKSCERNKELVIPVLRQIAINVHVVYRNFDRMHIDEVAYNMRKNGIKAFLLDLHPQTKNPSHRSDYIQKHMRKQAKAKILWIHNQILHFISSSKLT